jgi:glycogen(starch) synthase
VTTTGRIAPSLRILVLTNLYPPFYLGGYELGCHDIVEHLKRRGHTVTVLTSTHGLTEERAEGHIHRRLSFRADPDRRSFFGLLQTEWKEQVTLRRLFREFAPDVVYVFSLYGVSHGMMLAAQRTSRPVVYAFSGEWLEPAYRGDRWLHLWATAANAGMKRHAKRTLGRLLNRVTPVGLEPLDLRGAYFTSAALRRRFSAQGFPVEDAPVIYWGVDLERFHPCARRERELPLRLLFAGRISMVKGLHTAIEALHLLNQEGTTGVLLDVAGPTQEPAYLRALQERIGQTGLGNSIRFLGEIPWKDMPSVYADHDVLVFPSIWEEPFSIGLLEAMACGQAVVGTTTGGSAEVLVDGVNSLVFPPGDPGRLAQQVKRLIDLPLRRRIGMEARRTVEQCFEITAMMDKIEAFLREVVARRDDATDEVRGRAKR